jgi:hypothetical protein
VVVAAVAAPHGIVGYCTINIPKTRATLLHRCSIRVRLRAERRGAARSVGRHDVSIRSLVLEVTTVRQVILIGYALLRHDDVVVNAGGFIDIKAAVCAHTETSRHLQLCEKLNGSPSYDE